MSKDSLQQVVLVFGLAGVGKTTLIRDFVTTHPDWVRVSGGDLIRQGVPEHERDLLTPDTVEKIEHNHRLLVESYRGLLVTERRHVMFDGHSTLKTSLGEDFVVHLDTIRALLPNKIVLVEAKAATILQRRRDDAKRPLRMVEDEEEIRRRQGISAAACRAFSAQLKIPLLPLCEPSQEQFVRAVLG